MLLREDEFSQQAGLRRHDSLSSSKSSSDGSASKRPSELNGEQVYFLRRIACLSGKTTNLCSALEALGLVLKSASHARVPMVHDAPACIFVRRLPKVASLMSGTRH